MTKSLRIVFVGAHLEARAPLEYLIASGENVVGLFTLDDDSLARMSAGTDLRESVGRIPVRKSPKVNAPDSVAWIRSLDPDILLVVGWTQLLDAPLLRVPRVASLGFHASLLPKYRGRAPVNWALINGEKQTGNTMMLLDPGVDEGDIVAQRVIEISEEDDCRTLYEKVSLTECEMLSEVLPLIREGKLPRCKQDSRLATIMPKRKPEDGLVNWNWPSRRLYDWVRALTAPYPGAFSFSGNRKVTIWKAGLDAHAPPTGGLPGSVQVDTDGYPLVVTGDGRLKVLFAQLGDDPPTSGTAAAKTFLRPAAFLGSADRGAR